MSLRFFLVAFWTPFVGYTRLRRAILGELQNAITAVDQSRQGLYKTSDIHRRVVDEP